MSGAPATPRLVALNVYPFKSAAGIAVAAWEVDEVGLRLDRRWMIVDDAGRFITQRTHPRMALLRTTLTGGELRVTGPGAGTLSLPLAPDDPDAPWDPVRVWHSDRYAADCGPDAAAWASDFLGVRCRVVRAVEPAGHERLSAEGKVRAGFADAEPALLISTASLEDLNGRLAEPLPMNRFRPNLVVAGVGPYDEDRWDLVRVGEVRVRCVRPCPRCVLTTVDQETAATGVEPLRTLATYRRLPDGGVGFGMNGRFESRGTLRVGDAIEAAAPSPPTA